MLSTFWALKSKYESTEISLDDLKQMQSSCDISFENRGIARSNLDCLLCSIVYNPLKSLKSSLENGALTSQADVLQAIEPVLKGSDIAVEEDDESISCDCELIDIVLTKLADGSISFEPDDVNIKESFDVYMRVQH